MRSRGITKDFSPVKIANEVMKLFVDPETKNADRSDSERRYP
jgi:hypothetical protein